MNIAIWLDRNGRITPHAPAILTGAAVHATYGSLRLRVMALAARLAGEFGIGRGDRLGIFMPNHESYFEAMFAGWWLGAIVVPINAKLHPKEAAWIVRDSGCRAVLVEEGSPLAGEVADGPALLTPDWLAVTPAAPREVSPPAECGSDEVAWLFYTSGTTGNPKGVMITHGNLAAMTACYHTDIAAVEPDIHWLYAAPISHAAGMYGLPHFLGGARHVIPPSGGFEPVEILELAKTLGNVSLFAAPTMVKRLVAAARAAGSDGPGLRDIVYGGGPMYVADLEDGMDVLGQRFVQLYGQGETPMTITALSKRLHSDRSAPDWRARLASVGTAQSLVEVRVVDEDGAELPPGEPGEVVVRGATVMKGYWNNPAATAAALRDGWLWTGDIGAMDANGFLTLRDRSKDVIISGGSNIYPREIEEVLLRHPEIAEVAVVGRLDAEWGELPVAFYVARTDADIDAGALDALCIDNIARFKRPRAYVRLQALPKNNYGKVLKRDLRERLPATTEAATGRTAS